MNNLCVSVFAAAVATAGVGTARVLAQGAPAKLTVESMAFKDGETIPDEYSSFGKNVSPPLSWSGAPATARQYASARSRAGADLRPSRATAGRRRPPVRRITITLRSTRLMARSIFNPVSTKTGS